MRPKSLLLPLGFCLGGIVVGVVIARSTGGTSRVDLPTVAPATPVVSLPTAPATRAEPVERTADLKPVDRYRERLRAMADINALLKAKFHVPLLDLDQINEDFVKLYGLTAAEVSRLKASFAAAKARIEELQAKYAVIVPLGENAYRIDIPPFPEEGGRVHDQLLESVHAVLGDERYRAYRDASTEFDSTMLDKFGLNETTIEIRPTKPGEASTASYSQTGSGADELMKVKVETDRMLFWQNHAALYRRMVAAGLWKPDGS